MIGIDTLVWFVFVTIIAVVVVGILWWLIVYCEQNFPAPMLWKVVRVVFVILCAFFAISILLALMGHPVVRM